MSKGRWIIFGAGLLALPFIFSATEVEQIREPKVQFLVMMAGIFLSLELGQWISWPLAAGAALCYVSAFFQDRFFPYEALLALSAALGSCFLFVHFKKNDVERFLKILEWMGILTALYAVVQFLGKDPVLHMIPGNDFHRVSAFFGQHTLYGPFCVAAAAPALFRDRYLRALLIAAPVPFIDSSFTYLAALVVLGMFLIFRVGRVAVLGLSLMAAAAAVVGIYEYSGQDYVRQEALNDNGRFALWKITWELSSARPLLGHGFATFAQQFPMFQSKEIRDLNGIKDQGLSPGAQKVLKDADELRRRSGIFVSAHNEFLQVFYEHGLLGVFIAICSLLTFFFLWVDAPDTPQNWALGAIFFSMMANSVGNFPLHLIPQALLPLWAFVLVTTCRDRGILDL